MDPNNSFFSELNQSVITVTDAALRRMKELLANKDECSGIRILVKSGGCCGHKYHIEYAVGKERPLEVKIEKSIDGFPVNILIEPKALIYIRGATVDYYSDKMSSGFTFQNPNEKGRCGCGESFRV